MQAILALIRKQFLEIRSSAQLRALTLILPLLQLILFGFAANLDVNNIPISVLDYSNSSESHRLIQSFKTSGYFTVVAYLGNYNDVDATLQKGGSKLVLVIPPDFSKKIASQQSAPLQALIDGSDGYTANIASGLASAIVASYSQKILVELQRRSGGASIRIGNVAPEPRVWYNPDLKSRRFFIPSIMGLLLLITTVIASSTSIVKEREDGTLEQLIVGPIKPWQIVVGKLTPFVITSSITLMNLLIVASLVFGITIRGNVVLFFLLTLVFLVTVLGLGLFVSTISKTQQQASFTTSFFVLPPFLFLSGYAFPIENMPTWIQPITYLVPLRYFLTILRGIFLKGVGLAELWPSLLALLACGVVIFAASFMRFRKNLE
jgi:ABC-2 type transport system permease protein